MAVIGVVAHKIARPPTTMIAAEAGAGIGRAGKRAASRDVPISI
jgi:hypothetical protein